MTTKEIASRIRTQKLLCGLIAVFGSIAVAADFVRGSFHLSMALPACVIAAVLLWPRPDGIEFSEFGWLWIGTLLLPICLYFVRPQMGFIAGIATPLVWGISMPTGCMGGAFAAFPMLGVQLASLAFWISRFTSVSGHSQ